MTAQPDAPDVVEARTLDGELWLKATDVTAALRRRASVYRDLALDEDEADAEVALYTVAEELEGRADAIDVAAIAHRTEDPTDSPLTR